MPTTVYLDFHATTPCDPAVVEAMLPYFTDHFGNAASRQHSWGLRASAAVDHARERVADAIGARPHEIVFTSGATEADNLALLGVADAHGAPGHVVTSRIEHKAVLEAAQALETRGWEVTWLTPDRAGRLTPDQVAEALRDDTVLVSLMVANNELGTVLPIDAIGAVCRERGVLFHTDAAQALGHLPLSVADTPVDLVSISAHKAYGPKGVGALWVRRRGRPRVALAPRTYGGGHERGLRSGTLPVPLIVGFGEAASLARARCEDGEPARLAALRDRLWNALSQARGAHLNGPPPDERLPHNLHIRFDGVAGRDLLQDLRLSVAGSTGSACGTGETKPSHVLTGIGMPPDEAASCVRFSVGRPTTPEDVDAAAAAILDAVAARRGSDVPRACAAPGS